MSTVYTIIYTVHIIVKNCSFTIIKHLKAFKKSPKIDPRILTFILICVRVCKEVCSNVCVYVFKDLSFIVCVFLSLEIYCFKGNITNPDPYWLIQWQELFGNIF